MPFWGQTTWNLARFAPKNGTAVLKGLLRAPHLARLADCFPPGTPDTCEVRMEPQQRDEPAVAQPSVTYSTIETKRPIDVLVLALVHRSGQRVLISVVGIITGNHIK